MIERYLPQPEVSFERYQKLEYDGNKEPLYYRELEVGEKTVFEFRLDPNLLKEHNIENLPRGYIATGGVARYAAFKHLAGIDMPVRDIDLGHVDQSLSDKSLGAQEALMRQYAPEDLKYGNSIHSYNSLEDYFAERDITLNEVAIDGGKLLITQEALHDMFGYEAEYDSDDDILLDSNGSPIYKQLNGPIIRPTQYEEEAGSGERLASRAVTFQAMFDMHLPEGQQAHTRSIDGGGGSFIWAVAFKKAIEYGNDTAVRFAQLYSCLPDSKAQGVHIDYKKPATTIHGLQQVMASFLHEGMSFFHDSAPTEGKRQNEEPLGNSIQGEIDEQYDGRKGKRLRLPQSWVLNNQK